MKTHFLYLIVFTPLASAWTNMISRRRAAAPANISISANGTSTTELTYSQVLVNGSASTDVLYSTSSVTVAAADVNDVQTTGNGRCDKKCTEDWMKCVQHRCWAYEWGCPKVCMYTICEIGPNECGGCQWC